MQDKLKQHRRSVFSKNTIIQVRNLEKASPKNSLFRNSASVKDTQKLIEVFSPTRQMTQIQEEREDGEEEHSHKGSSFSSFKLSKSKSVTPFTGLEQNKGI